MLVAVAGLAGCGGTDAALDNGGEENPALWIGVIRGNFRSSGPVELWPTPDPFWYALALRQNGADVPLHTVLIEDELWRVDLDFEFSDLAVGTWWVELLRHRLGDEDEVTAVWTSDPVTLTMDSPLADDLAFEYSPAGIGDGIVNYQYRLYGNPSENPELDSKTIYTCFRVVGDADQRLFRQSHDWHSVFDALPDQPWFGVIFDDLNGDYETDTILPRLPDVEIIIGVYGFEQEDATGDEYDVYGELEIPARPSFGDDDPEPVVIDVDFGTIVSGDTPGAGGAGGNFKGRQ